MMDFAYIGERYGLGAICGIEELAPGTASRVWRVESESGAFLLRSLSDREQGEREWSIFSHLRRNGFIDTPAILSTKEGLPCVELDGLWYQLQGFTGGFMPDLTQPQAPAKLARLVKEFSAALADYPSGPVIHGDFGPWNILCPEDGRLVVIDLGDACEGDPYFDYATLLAGVINHTPPDLRESVCGAFVRELDCDRVRLLDQLRLWSQQGIANWTGRNNSMVSRFINARKWAEEHLYEL